MTEELTMEKFTVRGLDCAACAAKIEKGLNGLEGVETAVLDFASLTLHVKTNGATRVLDAVNKIEPQVQLLPKSEKRAEEDFSVFEASIKFKGSDLARSCRLTFCFSIIGGRLVTRK